VIGFRKYDNYTDGKQAWLNAIPSHWNLKKNKYLFTEKKDVVGENSEEYVLLSLSLQGIIPRDMENPSGKFPAEFDTYKIVNPNDLVFCLFDIEETPRTVGYSSHHGMITGAYTVVECNKEVMGQYIYYYYLYLDLYKRLGSLYTGLRKVITRSNFFDIKTPVPPLSEQQAIADFLDCKIAQIDKLIEKKQRQIDLLQEQRTALINHAVTKGLHLNVPMKDSGVEWLGEIPSHWIMTKVRYYYDVKLGKMFDSNKQIETDYIKPYLRAANIHWNKILLDAVGVNEMSFSESHLERYSLQSGDLLVTEGGVTVGRSAIWNDELAECYYQNSLNRARPLKDITTKWLYYWMYFVTNNGFIDIVADKSTFGHLTNEKLKALPIPIPPISEHDEIIAKLEAFEPKMEAQVTLIEKQIDVLQEYRTALISEAVTGKIDVREWRKKKT
jgi:type I restriction enzyme, S subunit